MGGMTEVKFAKQGPVVKKILFTVEASENDSSCSNSGESIEDDSLIDETHLGDNIEFVNESLFKKGPQSELTLGEHPSNGKSYVTKWLCNKDNFEKEHEILRKLNHANVVRLLGMQLSESNERRGFIHSLDIIHRDLKPENFLRISKHSVQLTDFGLSQLDPAEGCYGTLGTPSFLAPESVAGNGHPYSGKKADVWALGMTLTNLLTGEILHDGLNKYEVMEDIRDRPIEIRKCQLLKGLDDIVMEVIEHLLNRSPIQRCSATEATKLPWLRNK